MISKTVEGYLYEEFIYCHCECQKTRSRYDNRGRECYFIRWHQNRGKNHPFYGKPISEDKKKKMIEANTGSKNHKWKGDNVGYGALHEWINRHLPKPEDGLCELCHKKPLREAANITEILNRDFKNWAYFCKFCHRNWDNITRRGWVTRKQNRIKYLACIQSDWYKQRFG